MSSDVYTTKVPSPIGGLTLTSDGESLTGLYVEVERAGRARPDAGPFREVTEQLSEYWAGDRREFDVPLSLIGTPFQERVWEALKQIPYGKTISYRTLAERVGAPRAARAVGAANGRNPVSIIVPCHRVIGAGGALVGYGWGLERKRVLLDLESESSPSTFPVHDEGRRTRSLTG
jgi:methylated-DNA-[protein]-cysteine S-methyltransferase